MVVKVTLNTGFYQGDVPKDLTLNQVNVTFFDKSRYVFNSFNTPFLFGIPEKTSDPATQRDTFSLTLTQSAPGGFDQVVGAIKAVGLPAPLSQTAALDPFKVEDWLKAAGSAKVTSLNLSSNIETVDYAIIIDFDGKGPTIKQLVQGWTEADLRALNPVVNGEVPGIKYSGTNKANVKAGGAGDDVMSGKGGADKLYGRAGDDVLRGDGGNDKLYGSTGNDKLFGGTGNDRLEGSRGNDQLWGGTGDDVLVGGTGADLLRGEVGDDRMYGGSGDDRFIMSTGRDRADGGTGADVFVFQAGKTAGRDTVVVNAADRVELSGYEDGTGISISDLSGDRYLVVIGDNAASAIVETAVDQETLTGLIAFV